MSRYRSRREFIAALSAFGLAGCSVDAGLAPEYEHSVSNSLNILTWSDYIDPPDEGNSLGTLAKATATLGLNINYEESYEDNFTSFGLIEEAALAANGRYDIVVPTNWRAAEMIERGLAQQLPIELIPNHKNLDSNFMVNSWDRGSRYQMPWQAGMTGIAYDPALTERAITSVQDLFDRKFRGKVGFIGEMREAVGLAMLANGDDPSRATLESARKGMDLLRDAVTSGQMGAVTFDDFAEKLATGELSVAMAWSGDTGILRADRPDIQFVIPDEGAIQWFDTMVIPVGAQNVNSAARFMNFVYEPTNAAAITRYVGYVCPVLGTQELLASSGGADGALATDPLLFPDASTRSRLYTWGGLSLEEESTLDDEFAELMGL